MLCSNAKKQQVQQQLAIVKRVLKMAVLSSNLAHEQVRRICPRVVTCSIFADVYLTTMDKAARQVCVAADGAASDSRGGG